MSKNVSSLLHLLFLSLCLVLAVRAVLSAAPNGLAGEQALLDLARAAVKAEVEGKRPPAPPQKSPVRPVFVTIEVKGKVVGCRGGLEPRTQSLEEEIVLAARAAAKHDPRHPPVNPKDLTDLQVTITVVERTEPLDRIESLPASDGLVLKSGSRVGVVLPWEGKDPKVRLAWARKKAGVPEGAAYRLYRLKAERFRG